MPELATAPAAATGIRKLNLGAIGSKKASGKTEYPALPASEETQALVTSILENSARLEALEGALEIDKAELTAHARQFYFAHCHGKAEIPSSVSCTDAAGKEVLISFTNRYKAVSDEAALAALVGEENVAAFFKQKFTLKIDGDLVPEDKQETLIYRITELFAELGCSEALTATSSVMPIKEFHTRRHALFTPAVNLELERISPIVAAVKTKGRKK